jgi:LAO/AO transport system kinase
VGQSEIEIAGLADTTVVVVVPEAGDEVQTMKAGLMEIADIFVVNKSDRPEADAFVKNLRQMLAPAFSNHQKEIPVIKTVASQGTGLDELAKALSADHHHSKENHVWLLTERLYQLVQKEKMKKIDKAAMKEEVARLLDQNQFNLYQLAERYKFH